MELIRKGLTRFPFDTTTEQAALYETYLSCLSRWNRVYNLTAITDEDKMVSHHLMDSLSVVPLVTAETVIDVGSGAGLPGIPLAVHFPGKHFTLLDSSGKKARFLTQACIELGLSNVTVVQRRVQDYRESVFGLVICRAFAHLEELSVSCAHLVGPGGSLIAMKAREEQLREELPLRIGASTKLAVPLMEEERWAIQLLRR